MFCSTIIPTVGRSSLRRAVCSILDQSFSGADFEVIVVNDSGNPLPREDWQYSERVRILHTNRHERSVARNTGATIGRGDFLHFLDDDDWMAPDAFQHFWDLHKSSQAKWLYGASQLMDRKDKPTIRLQHGLNGNAFIHAMAGEWIPLQASLIERKTFFRIGGFDPGLTGPEDIDLLRRVLIEENIAETTNLVAYIILGELGSTTDFAQHPAASRRAREKILDASNAFQRMRAAVSSSQWYGRLLRIYLTSVMWNIQHRNFLRAASRGLFSTASVLVAGTNALSADFWRAVVRPYASFAFEKGIQEARNAG